MTNNNNRRHNLFTFTFPYAYNETYSYVTSNSYHITHVDFILFRFHIIITFVLLPCVMSFTGCNSYLLHVSQVRSYQSKLIHIQWQVGTDQSHIKYIQGHIRLIQIQTLVHSRYKSHQIHILGSYRFRTYLKTNRFIGLYHNHIQTYTYSCQGIRFVSFTCFMTFSSFRSCSYSCHLHNSVYFYLMTFNRILTSPVGV